jgi:hypothetical protein
MRLSQDRAEFFGSRIAAHGISDVAADLYEFCGMLAGFGLASRGGVGRSGSVAACRLWAGSK